MNCFQHDWEKELYDVEKGYSTFLERSSRKLMVNEIKEHLKEADSFLDFLEEKVVDQKYNQEYISQIIIWAENQIQQISQHIYQKVEFHNEKYGLRIVVPPELTDFSYNFIIVRALSRSIQSFVDFEAVD
jgi:hypothetical protein